MMKNLLLFLPLLLISCASAGDAAPNATPEAAAPKPTRVLFVGNSFTFWGGGMWKQLDALSGAMDPPLLYTTERVVRGGASLEVMWNRTAAPRKMAEGRFDVVVLQGDIPETTVDSFRKYSRRFVEAAREVGTRPVLFMTWDYERLDWISMEEIAAAHREMAKALDVEVAPVGLAWKKASAIRPDLDMYSRDREHPSGPGMYLALMVVEAAISGADPRTRAPEVSSVRAFRRVNETDRKFLREIAAQAIADWKAGK